MAGGENWTAEGGVKASPLGPDCAIWVLGCNDKGFGSGDHRIMSMSSATLEASSSSSMTCAAVAGEVPTSTSQASKLSFSPVQLVRLPIQCIQH